MPDPYIIISGGEISNDPDRHVFDLDSLEGCCEEDAWAFVARVAQLASTESGPLAGSAWPAQRRDFISLVEAAIARIGDFE